MGISTRLLFVLSHLFVNTIMTKGKPGLRWEVGGDLPLREVVVLVLAESRTFFSSGSGKITYCEGDGSEL